jgi:phage gp29-like protein
MLFNYELLRTGVYPDTKEFYRYCDLAEEADFNSRSITALFKIIKRPLKVNRRLFGVVKTRRTAIRCFNWSIVPRDGKSDMSETTSRVFNSVETLLANQLKTELYGRICFPLELRPAGSSNTVYAKPPLEPWEFDFNNEELFLIDQTLQKKPADKTALFLTDVTDDDIGGLIRVMMPDEIMRYDMALEYGNFLRKLKGIFQIVNKGASKEDEAAAVNAAVNIVRNNFVVTGEDLDFKLNDVVHNTGAAFKEFLDSKNADQSIAVLGQANTTQLPNSGGSRAALQILKLISSDIFYSDMVRVENLINKYLLIDYQVNYERNATLNDLPYYFWLKIEQEEDVEKNAIAIREILNSGIQLKKEEVYRKLGFTVPDKNDEVITTPATPTTSV